eukprot:1150494-Pelagomonas_calceolata.AAC.3
MTQPASHTRSLERCTWREESSCSLECCQFRAPHIHLPGVLQVPHMHLLLGVLQVKNFSQPPASWRAASFEFLTPTCFLACCKFRVPHTHLLLGVLHVAPGELGSGGGGLHAPTPGI